MHFVNKNPKRLVDLGAFSTAPGTGVTLRLSDVKDRLEIKEYAAQGKGLLIHALMVLREQTVDVPANAARVAGPAFNSLFQRLCTDTAAIQYPGGTSWRFWADRAPLNNAGHLAFWSLNSINPQAWLECMMLHSRASGSLPMDYLGDDDFLSRSFHPEIRALFSGEFCGQNALRRTCATNVIGGAAEPALGDVQADPLVIPMAYADPRGFDGEPLDRLVDAENPLIFTYTPRNPGVPAVGTILYDAATAFGAAVTLRFFALISEYRIGKTRPSVGRPWEIRRTERETQYIVPCEHYYRLVAVGPRFRDASAVDTTGMESDNTGAGAAIFSPMQNVEQSFYLQEDFEVWADQPGGYWPPSQRDRRGRNFINLWNRGVAQRADGRRLLHPLREVDLAAAVQGGAITSSRFNGGAAARVAGTQAFGLLGRDIGSMSRMIGSVSPLAYTPFAIGHYSLAGFPGAGARVDDTSKLLLRHTIGAVAAPANAEFTLLLDRSEMFAKESEQGKGCACKYGDVRQVPDNPASPQASATKGAAQPKFFPRVLGGFIGGGTPSAPENAPAIPGESLIAG